MCRVLRQVSIGAVLIMCCILVMDAEGQRHRDPPRGRDHSADDGEPHLSQDAARGGSLLQTIQCPVCDYGIAAVAKEVILNEIACRVASHRKTSKLRQADENSDGDHDEIVYDDTQRHENGDAVGHALPFCDEIVASPGTTDDASIYQVSASYAYERILQLCDSDIGRYFPATEILYAADDRQKREQLERQMTARPIEKKHLDTISIACRRGVTRKIQRDVARKLTELAWGLPAALPATVSELLIHDDARATFEDVAHGRLMAVPHETYVNGVALPYRGEIYRRVVQAQSFACTAVCGPIERPQALRPPRAAGFSAAGERLRNFEHLSFTEAESMRSDRDLTE